MIIRIGPRILEWSFWQPWIRTNHDGDSRRLCMWPAATRWRGCLSLPRMLNGTYRQCIRVSLRFTANIQFIMEPAISNSCMSSWFLWNWVFAVHASGILFVFPSHCPYLYWEYPWKTCISVWLSFYISLDLWARNRILLRQAYCSYWSETM